MGSLRKLNCRCSSGVIMSIKAQSRPRIEAERRQQELREDERQHRDPPSTLTSKATKPFVLRGVLWRSSRHQSPKALESPRARATPPAACRCR